MESQRADHVPHTVAVVIPVYRGAATLPGLLEELASFTESCVTRGGHPYSISEVLLVHDCGPDDSDQVIRELASKYSFVRPIWLSRNFGQHAATLAGMASTASDWIITMDEDGQHDPAAIPFFLDVALAESAAVVYANPTNDAPHGWFRNLASRSAKALFVRTLSSGDQPAFHSFRLVLGEIGRSVAAYGGSGVYLDVALGWLTQRFAACPVVLRNEGGRESGYRLRTLASHFWRLVLTSGTRPLRLVSLIGTVFALLGFIGAGTIVVGRIVGVIDIEGWASLSALVLVGTGLVLFSLGLVAEYVGVAARMALGKPPFLIASDPADGPLGRVVE